MSSPGCKRRQAPSSTATKPKTVHQVHINSLPDICLQAIFKNQPLTHQLCNLAVCPKWEMVQRNEFRSRKSLIIDFGGNSVDQFETTRIQYSEHLDDETQKKLNYDSLKLIRFNSLIVKYNFYSVHSYISDFGQLANYFSNVTTCRIASNQPRRLGQSPTLVGKIDINDVTICRIIKLLTSVWQSKLTTFELYISLIRCPWINMVESKSILRPMFSAINRLSSLKHLTLIFDSDIFKIKPYDVLDEGVNYPEGHMNMSLPILSQLESFCFASDDSVKCIIPTLICDATGNEKLEISFTNRFKTFRLSNDPKGYLPLQLTQKFTQLCLYSNVDFLLLPKCPNLTSLYFEDSLDFSPANIKILSELKLLLVLYLNVNEAKDISSVQYSRLGSVKILHLRTHIGSQLLTHQDMAKYHIPWIFPGLQVLTIFYHNARCDTCGYSVDEFGWGTDSPDSQINKKCLRSFACPLKEGLPNLKYGYVTIKNYAGNSQRRWTFDELSSE